MIFSQRTKTNGLNKELAILTMIFLIVTLFACFLLISDAFETQEDAFADDYFTSFYVAGCTEELSNKTSLYKYPANATDNYFTVLVTSTKVTLTFHNYKATTPITNGLSNSNSWGIIYGLGKDIDVVIEENDNVIDLSSSDAYSDAFGAYFIVNNSIDYKTTIKGNGTLTIKSTQCTQSSSHTYGMRAQSSFYFGDSTNAPTLNLYAMPAKAAYGVQFDREFIMQNGHLNCYGGAASESMSLGLLCYDNFTMKGGSLYAEGQAGSAYSSFGAYFYKQNGTSFEGGSIDFVATDAQYNSAGLYTVTSYLTVNVKSGVDRFVIRGDKSAFSSPYVTSAPEKDIKVINEVAGFGYTSATGSGTSGRSDIAANTTGATISSSYKKVVFPPKEEPAYTAPTAKTNLVYSNAQKDLINAGSVTTASQGTMQYKLAGGTYSTTIPKATDAGTYTVYYKVFGASGYFDTDEYSLDVTIAKATPTLTAPTASSGLVYNTNAQYLCTSGSTNYGTLQYKVDSGSYSTTRPSATNVGTYTVYYKVVGNGNVNSVAEKSFTVSIAKATPTVTPPDAAAELVYDGQSHNLCTAGSTSVGTMQYKVGSGSYSTTRPSATNAGTYTVYYKVAPGDNYNTVEDHFNVTIAKATPIVTPPDAKAELEYDGQSHNLCTLGSTNYGTLQYKVNSGSYSTTRPSATNAGTYTIYYKVVGDANINNVDENSFTVTIAKATLTVTPPDAKAELVYDGQSYNLCTAGTTTIGTMEYKVNNGSYTTERPSATNAGTYTVYYKVAPGDNYETVEGHFEVTIAKATPTVTPPDAAAGLEYDGQSHNLCTLGSTSIGTIKYKVNTGEYSTERPSATNAGTYAIYFKVFGDDNIEDSDEYNFEVIIAMADPTITYPRAKEGLIYDGESQELIVAGSTSGGKMQYKLDDGAYSTSVPKATDPGEYVVYYCVDGEGNYEDFAESSLNVSIAKITPIYKAPTIIENLKYTSEAQALINEGTTDCGEMQYKLDDGDYSTLVPSAINVGTYTVYFRIVGDATHEDVDEDSLIISIAENDKTNLSTTITKADELYNSLKDNYPQVAQTLKEVLDRAKDIKDEPNVTQKQIKDIDEELKKAILKAIDDSRNIIDDEDSNTTIETEDGSGIPTTIELKVEVRMDIKAEEGSADRTKVEKLLKSNEVISEVFDVKLIQTIDGVEKEIQPSDVKEGLKIIVHIKIKDELVGQEFKILHIHNADDIEEITDFTINGNEVSFEVDRFSEFAFVIKDGLPTWAIVLIVIGCILLIGLIALLIWLFMRKKKDNDKEDQPIIEDELIADEDTKEQNEGMSLKDALAASKAVVAASGISKKSIANYLKSKDNVEVNERENFTKTGLPLADTHYINGKCFAYVYETDNSIVILGKMNEDYASKLKEKHPNVNLSAFPKQKDSWYNLIIDDTYTQSEIEDILDDLIGETKVDEGISLKDSMKLAKATLSSHKFTKAYVCEYLKDRKDVELNTRDNYTRTGLPLADTHYVIKDGKKICFAYVYETEGSIILLAKMNSDYANKLKEKHKNVNFSAFPKQKDTWYSLVIDDTYTKEEFESIIDYITK